MTSLSFRLTSDDVCPDTSENLGLPRPSHIPKSGVNVTDRVLPRGFLIFEDHQKSCSAVLAGIERYGEDHIPSNLPSPFKEHYMLFRVNLDLWERLPIKKAMSKRDIIVSCLTQGPAFAEWLKKARYYSFADKVSDGGNDIPEEYVLPGYKGYDSLLRETELIHWKEETSDVEYSFVPVGPIKGEETFKEEWRSLLREVLPECQFPEEISTLDWIKASRGYDPSTGKTVPVRDEMRALKTIGTGYLGKRTIIRPFPGGIRDTAIPDADTLAKIKLSHDLFAEICEHCPNSGMSSSLSWNFSRVLRRNLFCHLDFKKAGLLFPRRLFVLMGEVLEEFGISAWFVKDIEDVYLDIDGETVRTERGFCLGWMNEALTVAIIVLLRIMRKEYNLSYDFIVYNDDVLIGDQDDDPECYCELFRFAAKEFFNSYQIFLSEKKIFTSKSAQFLEEYYFQDIYGLDMTKHNVANAIYAKSLCSQYVWEAKMYCEAAYALAPNESNLWDCMLRGRESSKDDEAFRPFSAGGWITPISWGLDASWEEFADAKYILALSEVKVPEIAEKEVFFSATKAFDAKHRKINSARLWNEMGEEVRDFLKEQSLIDLADLVKTRLDNYGGKKKVFPVALDLKVANLQSKFWDPP